MHITVSTCVLTHPVYALSPQFRALMEYFLEPDPTMDPNRFFTALLTFASDVKAARTKVGVKEEKDNEGGTKERGERGDKQDKMLVVSTNF